MKEKKVKSFSIRLTSSELEELHSIAKQIGYNVNPTAVIKRAIQDLIKREKENKK